MVMVASETMFDDPIAGRMPSVVVVDPEFDSYKTLAESARLGRIELHFRTAGRAALKLADRRNVDAWLIAAHLDDMSGHDLVALLREREGDSKVAMIEASAAGTRQRALAEHEAADLGVDVVFSKPITVSDLEELLGLSTEERSRRLSVSGRTWAALPVSIGAAMVAMAVLLIG